MAVNFVGLMIFWLALFSCSSSAKRVRGCTASSQDSISSKILLEAVLPCVPAQVLTTDSKMYLTLSTSRGTRRHSGVGCACRNKQVMCALLKRKQAEGCRKVPAKAKSHIMPVGPGRLCRIKNSPYALQTKANSFCADSTQCHCVVKLAA